MQVKTILNRVQKFKGFVFQEIGWLDDTREPVQEVAVVLRANSRGRCKVCSKRAAGYNTKPPRRYEFIPFWGIRVFLARIIHEAECEKALNVFKIALPQVIQTQTKPSMSKDITRQTVLFTELAQRPVTVAFDQPDRRPCIVSVKSSHLFSRFNQISSSGVDTVPISGS